VSDDRRRRAGQLAVGLTWAAVLLGIWWWGVEITDGHGSAAPTTRDVAAVARPARAALPQEHAPLAEARPVRIEIPSLGVRAKVVERGLDLAGGVDPPPYDAPGVVGWFGGGPAPGTAGTAVLIGHVDRDSRPAVFFRLSHAEPGERIRVTRDDGSVAEFTVEAIEVVRQERFDPRRVYGPHVADRAELRLITSGGGGGRERGVSQANVVVSAYFTGVPAHSRTA
jgi:sortase (surface protein transpeptidase)